MTTSEWPSMEKMQNVVVPASTSSGKQVQNLTDSKTWRANSFLSLCFYTALHKYTYQCLECSVSQLNEGNLVQLDVLQDLLIPPHTVLSLSLSLLLSRSCFLLPPHHFLPMNLGYSGLVSLQMNFKKDVINTRACVWVCQCSRVHRVPCLFLCLDLFANNVFLGFKA